MARSASSGDGSDFGRAATAGVPYIGVGVASAGKGAAGGAQIGGASDRIPGSGSLSIRSPRRRRADSIEAIDVRTTRTGALSQ
jgi:hypothetical protein